MKFSGALLPALILSAGILSGCEYMMPEGFTLAQHRVLVQQGNVLDEKLVRQLRTGMTPEQVRFLMGSPMIQDPFHPDLWKYPYYKEASSADEESELGLISVRFKDNKVSEVRRLLRIDPETEGLDPSLVPEMDESDLDGSRDESGATEEPLAEPEESATDVSAENSERLQLDLEGLAEPEQTPVEY